MIDQQQTLHEVLSYVWKVHYWGLLSSLIFKTTFPSTIISDISEFLLYSFLSEIEVYVENIYLSKQIWWVASVLSHHSLGLSTMFASKMTADKSSSEKSNGTDLFLNCVHLFFSFLWLPAVFSCVVGFTVIITIGLELFLVLVLLPIKLYFSCLCCLISSS